MIRKPKHKGFKKHRKGIQLKSKFIILMVLQPLRNPGLHGSDLLQYYGVQPTAEIH